MTDSNHHVERYQNRNFDNTVEIWCSIVDEVKVILGKRYVRNCPMCGSNIEGWEQKP